MEKNDKNIPTPAEFIHRTGSVLGKAPSCMSRRPLRASPLRGRAEMDGRNGGNGLGSTNLPHWGELVGERSWLLVACPFLVERLISGIICPG